MTNQYGESSWGISHLSGMPITTTVGLVLLFVLILLIVLRVAFADVRVGVGKGG